jgi:hypothetical protein
MLEMTRSSIQVWQRMLGLHHDICEKHTGTRQVAQIEACGRNVGRHDAVFQTSALYDERSDGNAAWRSWKDEKMSQGSDVVETWSFLEKVGRKMCVLVEAVRWTIEASLYWGKVDTRLLNIRV